MSGTEIAVWIIGASSVITGLGILWRFVSVSAKLVNFVEVHAPVLSTIAEQFKKNGGNSLKDQIDRIEKQAIDAKECAVDAHKEAKQASSAIIRTDANVTQLLRMLTPKVTPPTNQ